MEDIMTIIKISPGENGGHANQTIHGASPEAFPIPGGWAVIPESLGTPETLENYPFGEVTVNTSGLYSVVTGWTPGEIPEPEAEPGYTELQLLGQQVTDLDLRVLAMERGNG